MLVSIVIPCFHNQDQLDDTVGRILDSIEEITHHHFELVLVDDCSTDDTWKTIMELSAHHNQVSGIRLKQNIGAYNAVLHGFEKCTGDSVLIMAADGDDPPELIPNLVQLYSEKTEAVLAVRESSEKGFFSILASRIFIATLKLLDANNIFPGGSDFMLVSKHLIDTCSTDGWKSGNTLIQLVQKASNVQTIGYTKGRSKPSTWSFNKKLKLFIQTINQFISILGVTDSASQSEIAETC